MKAGQVLFDSGPVVRVEIATEPHEHSKGLMGRTSLEGDEGMLFAMSGRLDWPFWMARTKIPLDLIFIDTVIPGADQGHVVGVLSLRPFDEKKHRLGQLSTHVLEVNGGFARRWEIAVGQRVQILET